MGIPHNVSLTHPNYTIHISFGSDAVIPLEVEIPSLRIAMMSNMTSDIENIQLRLEELDTLDEVRLKAQQNLELYRAQMERAYNKLGKLRTFLKGEIVLVLRQLIITSRHIGGKFEPIWQ